MADSTDWKVRGPVWRLRTELAEWDPADGAWQAAGNVAAVTFRRDGQISEGESHYPNGSVARWARIYDDGGRIIEEQTWVDDGQQTRVLYSYDPDGRMTNAVHVAADGARRQLESCSYDAAGRKTKVTTLLAEHANARHVHYSVQGSDVAYSAPGAATLTVSYDDRELPAEATFHDAHGGVIRRIVFSRDPDGRVLTEVVRFGGEDPFARLPADTAEDLPEKRAKMSSLLKTVFVGQVLSSMSYAYDSRGRLVDRTVRVGVLVTERTTFHHDDHDNPIAETWEGHDGEIGMDDEAAARFQGQESRARHCRFDYQYDAQGNWIERVGWTRTESQPEFSRASLERRTIAYYEP